MNPITSEHRAALSVPVRFSNLKHIARSPMHYHDAVTRGRDDKPWLRGGRGLHAVLFGTPYVVFNGAARRGKEWERFCEEQWFVGDAVAQQTHEVILAKELPLYELQAESIREELRRQGLSHLLEGDIEKRIEWEWLGRKCAGTPDVVGDGHVVDVKTTCNADPRRFVWDARKFSYAEQVTWYDFARSRCNRDVATGAEIQIRKKELFIIAVEKTPPCPVVIWRVTDAKRLEAEKTLRLWFEQLLACEASDQWPGYVQCVQDLDVLGDDGVTLTIGEEEVEVE